MSARSLKGSLTHDCELLTPSSPDHCHRKDISIVPILVGAINKVKEESFGNLLAPYFAREDTLVVVSSDFCHWRVFDGILNPPPRFTDLICRGTRFQYTYYYPHPPPSSKPAIRLSRSNSAPTNLSSHPIHASISALDHEAMELLTMPPSTACSAHHDFAEYLARTKNTICGRHPIGVLLGALSTLEKDHERPAKLQWVRYEQSSKCLTISDSSVSYASAYVTF